MTVTVFFPLLSIQVQKQDVAGWLHHCGLSSPDLSRDARWCTAGLSDGRRYAEARWDSNAQLTPCPIVELVFTLCPEWATHIQIHQLATVFLCYFSFCKWRMLFARTSLNTTDIFFLTTSLPSTGVYVIGFSYPVVPKGKARIRVQISAAHTDEDIDRCVDAFIQTGRKHGVVSWKGQI